MSCCHARADGLPLGPNTPFDQGVIVENVVPATAVGSTDDRVVWFTAASIQLGVVDLAEWLVRTDSAVLGTTQEIIQSGWYHCFLAVPWSDLGSHVGCFVTKNGTAAQRQAGVPPQPNEPEIYGHAFKQNPSIQSTAVWAAIPITQADIDAGGGANVIRAHAYNPIVAAAVILAADFVNGPVSNIRVQRIGDISG